MPLGAKLIDWLESRFLRKHVNRDILGSCSDSNKHPVDDLTINGYETKLDLLVDVAADVSFKIAS